MIAITVGTGLTRPVGVYTPIPDPAVDNLARVLSELPAVEEGWMSGHLWKDNLRRANLWLATSVVILDLDYETDGVPFDEHRDSLVEAATSGKLPGSIFYLTPHGARVLFVLDHPYSEKKDILSAAEACNRLAADAIAGNGYKVDEPVTRDLARLYFTPNARAKGVARHADVLVMRREQYSVAQLIADAAPMPAPTAPVPAPAPRRLRIVASVIFEEAKKNWAFDHKREYPTKPSLCPVCSDSGSFHAMPDDPDHWYCFSTDHPHGAGKQGDRGYHGDALDLEAHARGCSLSDVLRADGYMRAAAQTVSRVGGGNAEPAAAIEPTPSPSGEFRPWRSRSYLTAVNIIEANARDVLEGRKLEFNDMAGLITLGRKPIRGADVSRIRGLIESKFAGGIDKNNNEIGLQLSAADIKLAVEQVAQQRPYYPVQEYLNGLTWDGVPRLDHVAEDILGADGTAINRVLIRKFFVEAAARGIEPGIKADTVLVLVGEQGVYKSTFFKVIAGDWFSDTPVDISSDPVRAYMAMRKAWILEWAELESLFRARDSSSVKAFLSSCVDDYTPKHAQYPVSIKRAGVIVGTSNPKPFLSDETGERRFWTVTTGPVIHLDLAYEQRDQLWAEAATVFRAWCADGRRQSDAPWWLSPEEEHTLTGAQEEHRIHDGWEQPIAEWIDNTLVSERRFTTADILTSALSKPKAQWEKRDEMRVANVMKVLGWKLETNKPRATSRRWEKK